MIGLLRTAQLVAVRRLCVLLVVAVALSVLACLWAVRREPLSHLIAEASKSRWRPVEARLADFAYGIPPQRHREAVPSASNVYWLMAAQQLRIDVGNSTEPEDLHRAGIAALLLGDSHAVEKLRAAAASNPREPRYWNDLAAAFYTRARADDNPHDLADALAAVDHALRLDAVAAHALFNRAMILEALNLRPQATVAWDAFLRADSTTEWAGEALRHANALRASIVGAQPARYAFEKPARGDESILVPVVNAAPERARRFGETVLLAKWARARENGQGDEAAAWLADARTIGSALHKRSGESLLTDAVDAIERCSTAACTNRLAEAHRRYDAARRNYAARRVGESLDEFRAVARMFSGSGSPMALVAEYYVINCLEDLNADTVFPRLERLLETSPRDYFALRAQILWTIGTNRARVGRPAAALDAYERALAEFTRLGEQGNMNLLQNAVAASESLLGRPVRAWRLRVKSFDTYSSQKDAGEMQRALELAGRMEAAEGHWEAASALFAVAMETQLRVNPRIHVSAMLWSALATERAGQHEAAERQLAEANRYGGAIPDAAMRETALDDLAFAEASVALATDPRRAIVILDQYLALSETRHRTFLAADACLLRARAARAIGNVSDAEHFYRAAIAAAAAQRSDAFDNGIVDAYFSSSTAAVDELTHMLVLENRAPDAFSVLDHGRGRTIRRRFTRGNAHDAETVPLQEIRKGIPDGVLILSYLPLRDETIVFTVGVRDGLQVTRTTNGTRTLQPLIEQLRDAIVNGDDRAAEALAERLYDALLAPLGTRLDGIESLVIVDDPLTRDVPFAALRDHARGLRVVERFASVMTPSAAVFASSLTENREHGGRAMIVGDPAFPRSRFPDLEPLPAARQEALALARLYPDADAWTGEEATADRFLDALPSARMIHIAAHAVASRYAAAESRLLFAPGSRSSGIVSAEQIIRSSCIADVVVLAGCRTAVASETPSDLGSLASTFLFAGARNVIGTLWNVEDEEAMEFSRHFHEHFRAGVAPAQAVRNAQRTLLSHRPLRAWSGFTLLGTGR